MSHRLPCCLTLLIAAATVAAQDAKPAAQDPPRRQPFRSGAHYVLVDAYPSRDGKPVLGLTADDFELLEDGKPQTIDRIEFIEHAAWTPLGERRDPNSQRAGFELARDPRYRVFVLYLDAYHIDFGAAHRLKIPLRELLNRMMGPRDLFGVLTPAQRPRGDLILGQLTLSMEEQLEKHWFWEVRGKYETEEETELLAAYPNRGEGAYLVALRRLDKVYGDLEELIDMFGALREERKNIIFFSDSFPSPPSRFSTMASDQNGTGRPPRIGVGADGKLTMGSRDGVEPDRLRTSTERSRLLAIDFASRFREMLQRARQANVSFYTVRPAGLDMDAGASRRGPPPAGGFDSNSSLMREGTSNLRVLSDQTDGIAVLASNDLGAGMGRIADDLSSHYVIGYYTSNTRWDGQSRRITVRLKSTGNTIRARREYRAPTEAEIAAIAASRGAAGAPSAPVSAGDTALSALGRLRPAARVQAYGVATGADVSVIAEIAASEIEEGRWKQGAAVDVTLTSPAGSANATGRIEPGARGTVIPVPVGDQSGPWQALVKIKGDDVIPESDTVRIERSAGTLIGRPIAYRAGSVAASPFRPQATFHFRRTERVRLDWPVLKTLESHGARLLDRTGKLLPVPVALATRDVDGKPTMSGTVNLAPLSSGDYLIELTAKAGDTTEQQLIAIRVAMAR